MGNRVVLVSFSGACILFAGCSHNGTLALSSHSDAPFKDRSAASNFRYSWALPKTLIQVDSTFTFLDCKQESDGPHVKMDYSIQISDKAVPDPTVDWVFLDASSTNSFWQDHDFDVKTESGTHLLQSFNSTATDQAGTILGNFFNGMTKIADIAANIGLEAVAAAPGKSPECGSALKTKQIIDTNIARLRSMSDQTTPEAKKLIAFNTANQGMLTIKLETLTLDPGFDMATQTNVPIDLTKPIGRLTIPFSKLAANGWIENPDNATLEQFHFPVFLDFEKALPTEFRPKGDQSTVQAAQLLRDGMWREVAYIPVQIRNKDHAMVGKATTLPFAQFGASRTLPLDAPTFGKADWTITFNSFGEVTEAKWGSAATGVGMSQTFLGATSAASGISADAEKAPSLDRATQDMQNQNTKLQAIINNQMYLQQCLALKAKGQVESCP